jgi:hypothetical protein
MGVSINHHHPDPDRDMPSDNQEAHENLGYHLGYFPFDNNIDKSFPGSFSENELPESLKKIRQERLDFIDQLPEPRRIEYLSDFFEGQLQALGKTSRSLILIFAENPFPLSYKNLSEITNKEERIIGILVGRLVDKGYLKRSMGFLRTKERIEIEIADPDLQLYLVLKGNRHFHEILKNGEIDLDSPHAISDFVAQKCLESLRKQMIELTKEKVSKKLKKMPEVDAHAFFNKLDEALQMAHPISIVTPDADPTPKKTK